MTAAIPSREPARLVVGDTWRWQRTLDGYPASAWTLTYYVRGPNGEFTIVAGADGDIHDVTVAKTTTSAYNAGAYSWTAVVDDGATQRFTVETGRLIELQLDPTKIGKGYDGRSHARRVLDAIEAVIEGRASKDQEEYSIEGRSLKRTPLAELVKFRNRYVDLVRDEDAAARINSGLDGGGRIQVRF